MNIALLCIAILTLLVIGGGFYVSILRTRYKIVAGYPDDPSHPLHKAARAHGNAIEYAPILALLIYCLDQLNPAGWIQLCIVLITIARLLVYFGLLYSRSLAKPQILRFIGSLGTYILGLVLAITLLLLSL